MWLWVLCGTNAKRTTGFEGQPADAGLARHAPHIEDDLRGCLTTGERAMLIELLDKVASYADKLPDADEA